MSGHEDEPRRDKREPVPPLIVWREGTIDVEDGPGINVFFVNNRIEKLENRAKAIMCPSNIYLTRGAAGVENAIHAATEDGPFNDAAEHVLFEFPNGEVPHGFVYAVDAAGRLKVQGTEKIIFAAMVGREDKLRGDIAALCVANTMIATEEHNLTSLAIPLVGSGLMGLMPARSLEAIGAALPRYRKNRLPLGRLQELYITVPKPNEATWKAIHADLPWFTPKKAA